jgi:hypothetical protein
MNSEQNFSLSPNEITIDSLKQIIYENIQKSGFTILDGRILSLPDDKDLIRKAHEASVNHTLEAKYKFISRFEDNFLEKYIINGNELDIHNIRPVLMPISNSSLNNLFNWIKLHWSIPVSSGYGRRLRYIVYDRGNDAAIGIIGLADPVYGLKDRENLIGWTSEVKKHKLKNIMDAFVLGAVPPYSYLLGGKLVASLVMSPRIRKNFRNKYGGRETRISNEVFDGKLAAITTASALGKSSMYDRIKIPGGSEFIHVGWSKGSGEFQFYNGAYEEIFKLARDSSLKLKNPKWGSGVRNRRTVIRNGLRMLGLPPDLLYHSVKRELFIVPTGVDSFRFLRGETKKVRYHNIREAEIADYAIGRWVIPRSERRKEYLDFKKEQYSLLK